MNLSTTARTVLMSVLPLSIASAQTVYILNRDAATGLKPAYGALLPGPLAPGGLGLVPYFARPDMPNFYAGTLVATGTPLPPIGHEGAIAIDQETRIIYATDGSSFLSQDAHSIYGSTATAPTASLPLTGWSGGPITGLAVVSGAGLMFICDGTMCQARSKTYPYSAVSTPFAMPPFPGVPGATALDYDPSSGHLWACNVHGATVQFTLSGGLIAAFPPPPTPGIAPVRGIAVNPMAGPFSIPPLVPQTPGFHICLTNGDKVFDALPPYGVISASTSFDGHCRGLAFSSDPVLLQGRSVNGSLLFNNDPAANPGPGWTYPQIGMTRPSCKNGISPCSVTLDGAAASAASLLIANVFPLAPAGGGIVIGGDVMWANPFDAFYLIAPIAADSSGHAELLIPTSIVPVGFHMVTQWLVPDATAYLGYDFSDALLFRIGLQ